MTTYEMTTIDSAGTRIRKDHNTAADVVFSTVSPNTVIVGTEKFVADKPLSDSKGTYQYAGDVWLRVSYGMYEGWMAYIHKGAAICKDFKDLDGDTTPPPPPPPSVDEDIIVTVDKGMKQVSVKRRDGQPVEGWTLIT